MQRLLPVAFWGRTRAYLHQPVGGWHDESAHGGQLCEVHLSSPLRDGQGHPTDISSRPRTGALDPNPTSAVPMSPPEAAGRTRSQSPKAGLAAEGIHCGQRMSFGTIFQDVA